jgi:hypothetical protein
LTIFLSESARRDDVSGAAEKERHSSTFEPTITEVEGVTRRRKEFVFDAITTCDAVKPVEHFRLYRAFKLLLLRKRDRVMALSRVFMRLIIARVLAMPITMVLAVHFCNEKSIR